MAEETEVAARVSGPRDGDAAPARWVAPVALPRRVQLVMLPLSLVALYLVARAAGTVLPIFVIAAVIAFILNPIVSFVQRGRLPRSLTVIAVCLAFFITLAGAGFLLSGPVGDQARSFQRDVPELVDRANAALPTVAVVRETVVYLRRHLVVEPWGPQPLTVDGPRTGAAPMEPR